MWDISGEYKENAARINKSSCAIILLNVCIFYNNEVFFILVVICIVLYILCNYAYDIIAKYLFLEYTILCNDE